MDRYSKTLSVCELPDDEIALDARALYHKGCQTKAEGVLIRHLRQAGDRNDKTLRHACQAEVRWLRKAATTKANPKPESRLLAPLYKRTMQAFSATLDGE